MRKRFNVGIILGIIALSLIIIDGLVGAIALLDRQIAYGLFEVLFSGFEGFDGIDMDMLYQIFDILQVIMIFASLIASLICIPGIIFLAKIAKDSRKDVNEFQAKNKGHILALVFLGVAFLESGSTMGSTVFDALSFVSIAYEVLCVMSFVFILLEIRQNKRAFDNFAYAAAEQPTFNNPDEVIDVEVTSSEDNQEEVTEESNKNLDELYDLLSKLEKSYKNNELSEEDYQRMKETIINNYYKK